MATEAKRSAETPIRAEDLPRANAAVVRLQIDHHAVEVPEASTVLRAAELAGVSVPSLCSHPELSPFGGCRLCGVEIAGVRGYPLACSTPVAEGMQVTTDTVALRETRREILQLILSQHPASCLVCGEEEDCRRTLTTIRKAGVATGCRSCTNDGDCELQRVAEQVGVGEFGYPVTYRGLEPEHDEPFYDRDYNLCILCGRCVRMCAEVRGASVLAFKYRGPRTLIGPAFGTSHEQAGCEFCGACVSVCPTGALADKVSKWDGRPDGVETSTCPLCSLGCQVELAHKDGRLSAARGAHDAEINDGQLCVRGRFCLPEATQHPSRARRPMLRKGRYFRVASWDEALGEVSARLAVAAPRDILMLVSSDLTNEGLYAAQRLVRSGLGSEGIDSTAGEDLPGGPAAWSRLFALPVSIRAVAEAEAVVVAGLDTRYSFSVAGVQVRRALRRGARLVTIDARDSSLARVADSAMTVRPGEEAQALCRLLHAVRIGDELDDARTLAVVIGPRVFDCPGADQLVSELGALSAREGVTVLPLAHSANLRGALELGALRAVLPGPQPTVRPGRSRALSLAALREGRRPAVLYLVGETPFTERPDCDYLIAQDLYQPPFEVDVLLPAASFAEASGTLTNLEGRVQEQRRVEDLPPGAVHGDARPDWKIFSGLAARLGLPDLEYADDAAVRAAIRAELPGFPAEHDRAPRRMAPLPLPARAAARSPADGATRGRGRFVLIPERAGFRHRGSDLSGAVEGLGELRLEDGLRMCPDDLQRLGVAAGGAVTVRLDGHDLVTVARPDADCPRGSVYATRVEAWGGLTAPMSLDPPARLAALSRLPAQPLRVRVTAGDRTQRSGSADCRTPARARKEEHGPDR